jgi:hypothetical protein
MIDLILEPKIAMLAEPSFTRGGIEFMIDDLKSNLCLDLPIRKKFQYKCEL